MDGTANLRWKTGRKERSQIGSQWDLGPNQEDSITHCKEYNTQTNVQGHGGKAKRSKVYEV